MSNIRLTHVSVDPSNQRIFFKIYEKREKKLFPPHHPYVTEGGYEVGDEVISNRKTRKLTTKEVEDNQIAHGIHVYSNNVVAEIRMSELAARYGLKYELYGVGCAAKDFIAKWTDGLVDTVAFMKVKILFKVPQIKS